MKQYKATFVIEQRPITEEIIMSEEEMKRLKDAYEVDKDGYFALDNGNLMSIDSFIKAEVLDK